MDLPRDLLEDLKKRGLSQGNFLGLLNVLIGRRVQKADGTVISAGLTWRELSALLKKVRWDKDAIRELSMNSSQLPPRDRERFWYTAIAHARVDSPAATDAGNRLADKLREAGYVVGPAPK